MGTYSRFEVVETDRPSHGEGRPPPWVGKGRVRGPRHILWVESVEGTDRTRLYTRGLEVVPRYRRLIQTCETPYAPDGTSRS